MSYLVRAHIPSSAEPCAFSTDGLSLAEKHARHLIAAGAKRVDIYDMDVTRELPIRSHEEIRRDMIAQDELPPVAIDLWPLPDTSEAHDGGCACCSGETTAEGWRLYKMARSCPVHS